MNDLKRKEINAEAVALLVGRSIESIRENRRYIKSVASRFADEPAFERTLMDFGWKADFDREVDL